MRPGLTEPTMPETQTVAGAVSIVAVVLSVSFIEGTWTWLLGSSIAEVAGQDHLSLVGMGLVLFAAWLLARVLILSGVPLERRIWILAGAGLSLALVVGTIQAGLLVPVQLVVGIPTPDYRGAGILLLVLTAYLWGRGLALSARVGRDRVIGHIAVSAAGLTGVLVFLPLTNTVQQNGMPVVLASFLLALASLLLVQLAGAESRKLTRLHWTSVGAGSAALLVLAGAVLTGALSAGILRAVAQSLRGGAGFASPVTNLVLIGAGYLTEYLVTFLRWLQDLFGVDTHQISQAVEQAEDNRREFEELTESPPEFLTVIFTVFVVLLFFTIVIVVFARLVHRFQARGDDDVEEFRTPAGPDGLPSGFQSTLARLANLGRANPGTRGLDTRNAIRHHYRAFQTLMARASLPRGPGQTAHEYQDLLRPALPPAEADVADLTSAYVQARYGQPDAPLPDADAVARTVRRIRESLRANNP